MDTPLPKALFIAPEGNIYPDYLICSGALGGEPCPLAHNGRIPDPRPLDPDDPTYSIDQGQPGDLCPPCAKHHLANLGHWQGHHGQPFPEELLPLRLFKRKQWLWLVVPGLQHADAKELKPSNPDTLVQIETD